MSSQPVIRVVEDPSQFKSVLDRRWPKIKKFDTELADDVKRIIDEVRDRGDAALIDYTCKFDGVKLYPDRLLVNQDSIKEAYNKVSEDLISAIELAKNRVETFQKEILRRLSFDLESEGVRIRNTTSPIRRVGCYVPGGQAPYASSLVMITVPAKVASVPEIVVCSPPRAQGEINPAILVAADICGVDKI